MMFIVIRYDHAISGWSEIAASSIQSAKTTLILIQNASNLNRFDGGSYQIELVGITLEEMGLSRPNFPDVRDRGLL